MSTATVTSKGQITIPVDVRQSLNIAAGDRVEFVQIEPGRFELVPATRSVRELKGHVRQAEAPGHDRGDERGHRRARCGSTMIGLDTNVLVRYCLIERIAGHAGCSATMTFDVNAARTAGMTLVE